MSDEQAHTGAGGELATDLLAPFSFVDAPVRGAIVRLDAAWARIARNHAPPVGRLLGEMLAGTALLAHLLKDTDVALQTRGDGLVHTMVTECFARSGLRGIARLRSEVDAEAGEGEAQAGDARPSVLTREGDELRRSAFVADEVADIEQLLGRGDLAITLRPPFGEAHQGIVPLQGASVAGCIEFYFATSEQLATHMWLTAADGIAAGLLLQRIPIAPESNEMSDAQADALWEEASMLASTLTSGELRRTPVETLLTNLFRAQRIRLLRAQPLEARCTCSRERSLGVLRLLGRDEVDSVLAERGEVDLHCQFCGTGYLFSGSDIAPLWDA
jgi:molecular chaperone Hsp33